MNQRPQDDASFSHLLSSTSDTLFQALLEAAPDAILITSSTGEITLVNNQTETLFGYQRNELLGKSVELLLPERLRDVHAQHREEYSAAPRTRPMGMGLALFGRRKDGTEIAVEISLSPVQVEDTLLVMAIIRDVSERKQLEEDLERLRDEWSLVIAHDLRQPVAAISMHLGVLELLQQRGATLADGATPLTHIRASTTNLNQMVSDLLDFARVEAQRLKLDRHPVDVGLLVSRVADRASGPDEEQRLVLTVPDHEVTVDADPGRIEQVISNLVSNAVKYGNAGSEIGITVMHHGDEVEVVVSNEGTGIPAEELPLLFTRFYRARRARSTGPGGLGLGLYISQGLIEAHGGRMWAESVPNETTSIHFTLPVETEAVPRQDDESRDG